MNPILEQWQIDFDDAADMALASAQFGFSFKPLSVNQYLIPVISRDRRPALVLSWDALQYKKRIQASLFRQVRGQNPRAKDWVNHQRYYSFWVVLRTGHKGCERIDADNCHKMIQDVFVKEGIVPDDRYCRDSRQLYGNFERAGMPDDSAWCVFIRWSNRHINPQEPLKI